MKKYTLKELVSTGSHARMVTDPSVVVGETNKGYGEATILDANATVKLVEDKVADLVGGATSSSDTLKELEDKIDQLAMSQITNDAGYVQQDSNGQLKVNETNITNTINKIVISNQPFPTGWPKMEAEKQFSDLITAMNSDSDITAGKVYLATVGYTDLPDSLQQAELKIEVMQWDEIRHIAVFTLSSSNQAPYNWHNTLLDDQLGSWYSYALVEAEPPL